MFNLCRRVRRSFATRVYFLGSDNISVSVAESIQQVVSSTPGLDLACVTSRPDRVSDQSLLSTYSTQHNISCWQLVNKATKEEDFLSLQEHIRSSQEEGFETIGIVASFGYMLPTAVIRQMGRHFYVVHPSLLPKYRGAAPLQHALLNGDTESGISIVTVSPDRFDAGSIVMQTRFPIADFTYPDLLEQTQQTAQQMVTALLQDVQGCYDRRLPQDDAAASPAAKLFLPDSYVDWSRDGYERVFNKYRALYRSPLKSIRTVFEGQVLLITGMQRPSAAFMARLDGLYPKAKEGSVWCGVGKGASKLFVRTWDGWVTVERLMLPKQKEATAKWFISQYIAKEKIRQNPGGPGEYFFSGQE